MLTVLTGFVAYRAYLGSFAPPDHYLLFLAVGALAVAAVFPMFRLYEPQRGAGIADELRRLVFAWMLLAALTGGAIFATKMGDTFSRVWVSAWLLRRLCPDAAHCACPSGWDCAGCGCAASISATSRSWAPARWGERSPRDLTGSPWAGFNVRGFYDDDHRNAGETIAERPVWATNDRLLADVAAGTIDQVWLALPLRADARIREILTMLREHSVEVRFVPDIYSFHLLNHSMTEVAGLPVISLTETPMSGINRMVKAIEDYLLASLLFLLAAPFMLLVAIGVKLSSPGPVLYRQERVTWNGERFEMLKFRTMPVDAEAQSGPVWTRSGERRATPFGTFLRRTSLDELPQFINVLRGEMSLVGPRPERPEFVERFRQQIPGYMQKHLVKAGITGWAQVNDLRGDSDLAQRIQYDLYYIDNWSLWFDLRILMLTLWHILRAATPADRAGRLPSLAAALRPRSTARSALALFAFMLAGCLAVYVALSVPGAWFPDASTRTFAARDLTLTRGTGALDRDTLVITAVDASGLALVTANADFRSVEYPVIAWEGKGFAERADVRFLWRTDYAPGKLNSTPVTISSGRLTPVIMTKNPDWVGRITGVALAVRGPMGEPVRIEGMAAKPGGAPGQLTDRVREWLTFEPWSGTSINAITGGADVQELPLPTLLVVALVLAAAAWFALARKRHRTAALPAVLALLFVAAWLVLDAQWMWNLARQVEETRAQYGGKDWREAAPRDGGRPALPVHREGSRKNAGVAGARVRRGRRQLFQRTRRLPSLSAQRVFRSARKRPSARRGAAARRLRRRLPSARRSIQRERAEAAFRRWRARVCGGAAGRAGRRALQDPAEAWTVWRFSLASRCHGCWASRSCLRCDLRRRSAPRPAKWPGSAAPGIWLARSC